MNNRCLKLRCWNACVVLLALFAGVALSGCGEKQSDITRFLVGSFTEDLPYIDGGIGDDPAPAGLSLWAFDSSKLGRADCVQQLDALKLKGPASHLKVGPLVICGRETLAVDGNGGRSVNNTDVLNLVQYSDAHYPYLKWTHSVNLPNVWSTVDLHQRVVNGVPLVFTAHYFSGNANILQLTFGGLSLERLLTFSTMGVVTPSHVVPERQDYRNTHGVKTHPLNENLVYITQLGCDSISQFYLDVRKPAYNSQLARASVSLENVLYFGAGYGPRALCFNPSLPTIMYVTMELACKVAVVRAFTDGRMETLQTISIIPDNVKPGDSVISAWVATDSKGTMLFASTRGHNSLWAVPIDPSTGLLLDEYKTWTPSGGKSPRMFSVHPSDKYIFAANHGGANDANITIFGIEGAQLREKHSFKVGCPTWIEWIEPTQHCAED